MKTNDASTAYPTIIHSEEKQKPKRKKKKRFHDLKLKTKEQQKTKNHITGPKYVNPNQAYLRR